jgi:hypothetical protein
LKLVHIAVGKLIGDEGSRVTLIADWNINIGATLTRGLDRARNLGRERTVGCVVRWTPRRRRYGTGAYRDDEQENRRAYDMDHIDGIGNTGGIVWE